MLSRLDESDRTMHSRVISSLLGVCLAGLALTLSQARAGTILVFGQTGANAPDLFMATRSGSSTTLSALDIPVTITGINNSQSLPASFPSAYFDLTATNTNAAKLVDGQIFQDYSGSFAITSGIGKTGINYLSGTFSDSVFGSGTGLTLTVSDAPPNLPGESVAFISDVISMLGPPHAMSFAFTNVSPAASIADNTLDSMQSNVAGSFSAIPEPSSVILLGIGFGLVLLVARHRMRGR
jgi:hypothetical protein